MPPGSRNPANPAALADVARHCVIPGDIAFTRYHELIAPELPGMGVTLDRWQEDIWYAALGVRDDDDHTLACDVMGVTLSIARQDVIGDFDEDCGHRGEAGDPPEDACPVSSCGD